MKRKFSSIWRIAIAMVLVLSLGLVVAAPAAADVSQPTVVVAPSGVGQAAQYTIAFITTEDLAITADDDIRVEFPTDTTVPGSYTNLSISINGTDVDTDVTGVDVDITGQLFVIDVPEDIVQGTVTVVFKLAAGITNPMVVGPNTLCVCTSREVTEVTSGEYDITGPMGPVDVYNTGDVFQASYDTITEALDHGGIAADWTVQVHADTDGYDSSLETWPLNIDVPGVTVESIDGAASTTIDASAETHADVRGAVQIWSGAVTFGGDGAGFTLIAPDASVSLPNQYGVELFVDGATSGVTIEGNTIRGSTNTGSDSPQVGIHIWGTGPYTTLTIKDNTLTTTYTVDMTPMWSKTSAGIITGANVNSLQGTFDGNTITGFSIGMSLDKLDAATTTIKNNTVTGCDFNGIWVSGTAAIDVYKNTISGCGGNGLAIGSVQDIDVYKNVIHGNGNGVKVYSGTDATKVTLAYNDIYSNTNTTLPELEVGQEFTYENYGVWNADTGTNALDAKYNWWGAIGGPDSSGVTTEWTGTALGNGDIVAAVSSSSVLYDPWLTEDYDTVITSSKRSYGSDAIELEAGWNTLSVPCGLKGSGDTFADIVAMGGYLDDWVAGYWYDASVPQWKGMSGVTTFESGKGFYINMSAASRFPVLYYDGMLDLPAYELEAGWNLIGSMFGIDKHDDTANDFDEGDYGVTAADGGDDGIPGEGDDDTESFMDKDVALDSIGVACSVVVSPSVPGQLVAWSEVTGDNAMIVGEAYWVFMTDPGTLAGFEVTPFYFIWVAP